MPEAIKSGPDYKIMPEELSMHSYAKVSNIREESSDCHSNNNPNQGKKRLREKRYVSLPKFKGVVPQQNGNWGAQIYANHQRIWLGTFKSESEAAKAYDSAAIKLRGKDSDRNFPWTNLTMLEPVFQSRYTVDEILTLIKDGSYPSKFGHFLSAQRKDEKLDQNVAITLVNGGISSILLFQKDLTPSDVGKLNRLVIPKKYAVKYFPYVAQTDSSEDGNANTLSTIRDVQLGFYDRQMRLWKFRYCYWKSSQSYVFTRGWNRFVKVKGLKDNDTVAFYVSEKRKDPTQSGETFFVIDVVRKGVGNNTGVVQNLNYGLVEEIEDQKQSVGSSSELPPAKKGFKLFGVQINL